MSNFLSNFVDKTMMMAAPQHVHFAQAIWKSNSRYHYINEQEKANQLKLMMNTEYENMTIMIFYFKINFSQLKYAILN